MDIEVNKPLILFYGEVRQGKSTILNCVRWVLGGAFPSDVLTHGQQEGAIQLDFDDGYVRREFYTARDGSVKARELQFVKGGATQSNPVQKLKAFVNPFLLNQDYLRDMTEPERKRYFLEVLGCDTTGIDGKLAALEQQASNLRAKIAGYGSIDLTPQPRADTDGLQRQIAARIDEAENNRRILREQIKSLTVALTIARDAAIKAQQEAAFRKSERIRATADMQRNERMIEDYKSKIAALELDNQRIEGWLRGNPELESPVIPSGENAAIVDLESRLAAVSANTAELEKALQEACAQNVRAEFFEKELKRDQQRQADEEALHQILVAINQLRRERVSYLEGLNNKIPGLCFDAAGNLTFEDTHAGMLSTSQLMRLSAALAGMYPEGFGLDLIDRAESLGKSIFGFIEKAKREEKSILATIVGEKPAQVPEEVGVFVVENGGVK